MGSTNPVFVLPGALRQNGGAIAKGLAASVTLGVGQFCTNPGLTIVEKSSEGSNFMEELSENISGAAAGVMLTEGIHKAYERGIGSLAQQPGVQPKAKGQKSDAANRAEANLLAVDAAHFLTNKKLEEEVFGPSTLAIQTGGHEELMAVAQSLSGHLTATVFGTPDDLEQHRDLIDLLSQKAGRLHHQRLPDGRGSLPCNGSRRAFPCDDGQPEYLGRPGGHNPFYPAS